MKRTHQKLMNGILAIATFVSPTTVFAKEEAGKKAETVLENRIVDKTDGPTDWRNRDKWIEQTKKEIYDAMKKYGKNSYAFFVDGDQYRMENGFPVSIMRYGLLHGGLVIGGLNYEVYTGFQATLDPGLYFGEMEQDGSIEVIAKKGKIAIIPKSLHDGSFLSGKENFNWQENLRIQLHDCDQRFIYKDVDVDNEHMIFKLNEELPIFTGPKALNLLATGLNEVDANLEDIIE